MPTIAETLRGRWKPSYATRVTGGSHAFDTALSFLGAGAAKRAELAKRGTLSDKGIAEAVREFADKGITPELKKFRDQIAVDRANLEQRRLKLGTPKIDPSDLAAAVLRQEYRTFLRGLDRGERARLLIEGNDPVMIAAVLEGQPALSGLDASLRALVVETHVQRTEPEALAAIAETEEALAQVDAAITIAERDIASSIAGRPDTSW
jgi:hypothetical protein